MKIKGSQLNYQAKQEALRIFTNRYTRDHIPQWARKLKPDGTPYPLQFNSDNEWLDNSYFYVDTDGNLNKHIDLCESYPTYPNNRR